VRIQKLICKDAVSKKSIDDNAHQDRLQQGEPAPLHRVRCSRAPMDGSTASPDGHYH
jgi:hypothetical protein